MYTRINLITSVLFIFAGLDTAYAKPELQRPEVGYQEPVSPRIFLNSEVTATSIGNIENLDPGLKWAIVSGDLFSSTDRIRVRVRCNNEWIDLYARRNTTGQFDQNVVYLRTIGNDDDLDDLPDLRIVHWTHDRLWIKFSKPSTEENTGPSDSYFEFDLTK